jgi:hypothetical protein
MSAGDAELLARYLEAKGEYHKLVAEWSHTPGDRVPEAVKAAEARWLGMKDEAGEAGPGDPLCCQRYGKLHAPSFSVAGCRWLEYRER